MSDPNDCITCGCCCFSESPRHARVTGDDYSRLDDETLVEWLGNEAFMKLTRTRGVSHCAALDVRPDGYFCKVYERRPQVCRDLDRGSGACEGERHAKGPRLVVLRSSKMDGAGPDEGDPTSRRRKTSFP